MASVDCAQNFLASNLPIIKITLAAMAFYWVDIERVGIIAECANNCWIMSRNEDSVRTIVRMIQNKKRKAASDKEV